MTTAQSLRFIKFILMNVPNLKNYTIEGSYIKDVMEALDVIERAIYFQRTQCILDVSQDLLRLISKPGMNKRDIRKMLEENIKNYEVEYDKH